MTHSFTTSITNPITDESARVEVFYAMRDVGVMMTPNERVRAVILSVALADGVPYELLDQLNNETIVDLSDAAATHWQDQMDLDRFGSEVI